MSPGVSKSILVIDDEKDILDSLSALLRRNGYSVSVANNGREGLALAKKEHPNLIILDLILPDIDGTDVAADLFHGRDTKTIPVVFLTSVWTKDEQAQLGEVISNRRIIAKPCKSEEILDIVKSQIGLAQ